MPGGSMLFTSLVVAILVASAPVFADTSSDLGALREFGVLGRWAPDCVRFELGEHEIFAISPSGQGTLVYAPGVPNRDRIYYIIGAERISGDRLQIRLGLEPGTASVEVILLKSSESMRVWSSRDRDGRMLVIDGLITGNGRESPLFSRCGP
jgi:hypothetical protein